MAPLVGSMAVLLALIATVWAFWPRSARPTIVDPAPRIAGRGTTEPREESKPGPVANLRVDRFEILHFADDTGKKRVMGEKVFGASLGDQVTVWSELSEPAYAYLIAFCPDGTNVVCDPDDEAATPRRNQRPRYPPPSKDDLAFGLGEKEGAGLYAFALVVLRDPLPPYREWKKGIGRFPWEAKLSSEQEVVWRDDERGLQPLTEYTGTSRGKDSKIRGSGGSIGRLASWLRGLPGVDNVTVEAFSVEPTPEP